MDQNTGSGKTRDFLQKNVYFLVTGLILLGLIIYYSNRPAASPEDQRSEETLSQEESQGDASDESADNSESAEGQAGSNQPLSGNVSAVGTLKDTDDQNRGNLVLDSSRGKIYIKTTRDFSTWMGKEVTLAAEGSLDSFVFLGFQEAAPSSVVAGTDTEARGDGDELAPVTVSGELLSSDNQDRGNYLISSKLGKIYLKSQRDYSALVGSNVTLTAEGSIESFTNAILSKN